MSLLSWKAEFFEDFSEFKEVLNVKKLYRNSMIYGEALQVAEISLKKWIGLTPENLKKHDYITIEQASVKFQDGEFDVDDLSCSLCVAAVECKTCPILYFQQIGCCSEYVSFTVHHDPLPMIELLERTVQKLKEQTNKQKN